MQSIGDDEQAKNILQQHYNDWVSWGRPRRWAKC